MASIVMALCSCCRGGCAVVRLCRSLAVRNPNNMAKKTIVSRDTSCLNKWLVSCFPKGPVLRVVVLGNVDLQWGSDTG